MKRKLTDIQETLDVLYGFVDYSMTHMEQVPAGAFSLTKITQLLHDMGNPQRAYPCIHVAGTKGKGSVCAMLAAALRNAGFKVGLYTSPHLIRINERFQVNGVMISDQTIIDIMNFILPFVDRAAPVSTFEIMTALAFEAFRRQKVDIAVIETGLGGRLDATNVLIPLVSVITSISMDHMNFLGGTLSEIAGEKAGIIKEGIPVVCAPQCPEAASVIASRAEQKHAELIDVRNEYRWETVQETPDGQQIVFWRVKDQPLMDAYRSGLNPTGYQPFTLSIPLSGSFQTENAVTAAAVLIKIQSLYTTIRWNDLASGFAKVFWPCRFERLSKNPLIIADGAHNQDSIQKLCALIKTFYDGKRLCCVFGCSEDKQFSIMIESLSSVVSQFIVTRSTHPRAADPEILADCCRANGKPCRLTKSLEEALTIVQEEEPEESVIIVTGSLFVAGGFRELLMKENGDLQYFDEAEDHSEHGKQE